MWPSASHAPKLTNVFCSFRRSGNSSPPPFPLNKSVGIAQSEAHHPMACKQVFLRQPPGPPARQAPAQRFRLARPRERRAYAFLDEAHSGARAILDVRLPVKIVLPRALAENEPHSATARSVPPAALELPDRL
jgi:hypothetical protein